MTPELWLKTLETEYLKVFVHDGGSIVRFAVLEDSSLSTRLFPMLADVCDRERYLYVPVDAVETKLHLIDQLFYGIARQIDWHSLARTFLSRALEACGHHSIAADNCIDVERVARLVEKAEGTVTGDLKAALRREVVSDLGMSMEFRLAMLQICLSNIQRQGIAMSDLGAPVIAWLRGELHSIIELRRAVIFQRIARYNCPRRFKRSSLLPV